MLARNSCSAALNQRARFSSAALSISGAVFRGAKPSAPIGGGAELPETISLAVRRSWRSSLRGALHSGVDKNATVIEPLPGHSLHPGRDLFELALPRCRQRIEAEFAVV